MLIRCLPILHIGSPHHSPLALSFGSHCSPPLRRSPHWLVRRCPLPPSLPLSLRVSCSQSMLASADRSWIASSPQCRIWLWRSPGVSNAKQRDDSSRKRTNAHSAASQHTRHWTHNQSTSKRSSRRCRRTSTTAVTAGRCAFCSPLSSLPDQHGGNLQWPDVRARLIFTAAIPIANSYILRMNLFQI